jgi:hypothetical protein
MKKVALKDAVGCRLGHDLTEINPEKMIKRRLFKRGHLILESDLNRLQDLGKNSIYVWQDDFNKVHEDEAAIVVAPLVAGENILFDPESCEGKISFYAACDGVFKVDVDRLYRINSLEIPSLPTLHTNFPVTRDKQVAAFRIIPLTCERTLIEKIRTILDTPLLWVKPFHYRKAGVIVTGNEVFEGRIKDGFVSRFKQKLRNYHAEVIDSVILPDDRERISAAVKRFAATCDIIFVTGGTSVDPDDQTVAALADAGVVYQTKGNPIQPGNNFTVGYLAEVCVCAVPAATLYYRATALDVFLPRLLTGERIPKETFFKAGHGGLCHFCKQCHFPVCPFAVDC